MSDPREPLDGLVDRVVGIDVGGTKTHVAIAHERVIESDLVVPTVQWRTGSPEQDASALAALIGNKWGASGLRLPLGVGAHGCDSTEQCVAMEDQLRRHVNAPVRVVNDAELMPWAMGIDNGIGLVAGTGSIAAGGWGWMLGDEGSAAGIVREATRAALRALDSDERDDRLVTLLLGGFQVTDGAELAMALTRSSSADIWGSHAHTVFQAADEGSVLAARVIDDAGAQLAALVPRLHARGVTSHHVVAGGGVMVAQQRLRDAFLAGLATGSPDVVVQVLDTPPVVGAVALATSLHHPPLTAPSNPEVTS
jgi:N-acetylglucosamine kinase-like BadF-type ATPase